MKIQLLLIIAVFVFHAETIAQRFDGIWKGSSLCQVKNSPCHDETVVYHISKEGTGKTYSMTAYKIVNGQEDNMGTLIFEYDEKQKTYVSADKAHDAVWEFRISDNTMKGTLMVKGKLYRLVDVKKE